MTRPDEHNGWTNYETWLAYCWIGCNDAATAKFWSIVAQAGDAPILTERLRRAHEAKAESQLPPNGLYTDLVNAALCRINWREIAERLIEENR